MIRIKGILSLNSMVSNLYASDTLLIPSPSLDVIFKQPDHLVPNSSMVHDNQIWILFDG